MKKFTGQIITVLGIGLLVFGAWVIYPKSCDVPIRYHIGEIDSRFNISKSTVKGLLREAEAVWEKESKGDLFVYNESRGIPVNFIFDDRQRTTNEANQYETTLDSIKGTRENVLSSYEDKVMAYEEKRTAYRQAEDRYEGELAAYNERVRVWNDRGGAPRDVHQELTQERSRLGDEQRKLSNKRSELDVLRRELNRLADQGNNLASEYNKTAATFTERFGDSRQFNQATYVGDAINVYQFEESDDLRLALAHEFGHALGVDHVENKRSVMYYLMGSQQLAEPGLTPEDTTAFSEVCGVNLTN